jgi:hypothetical protein
VDSGSICDSVTHPWCRASSCSQPYQGNGSQFPSGTDNNGYQFPAIWARKKEQRKKNNFPSRRAWHSEAICYIKDFGNGGNGFWFLSFCIRKRFSVFANLQRTEETVFSFRRYRRKRFSARKRFSVSYVLRTETLFSFLQARQRTEKTVFSFRHYRRKWFSVSCEFGRKRKKRSPVSVVIRTETVFSFLRVWQRKEETVFSFRRCTNGNGFQFPARLAENSGNGFQFPPLYRRKRFQFPARSATNGGNGFQFLLQYGQKRFSVSCKAG